MPQIRLTDLDLGYGGPLLLKGGELSVFRGDRIGVVGRNGTGKSSLLKSISGELEPLGGTVSIRSGVRVAMLEQQVPSEVSGTIFDQVALGLEEWGQVLQSYHQVSAELARRSDPELLQQLDRLQHQLETGGGWTLHQRVEKTLTRIGLDPDQPAARLSAGLKRRVLLARALVGEPDVLLLDEPTNHLDLEAIAWVEEFLLRFEGTLLFITHDRALLRKLATRVVLIDRGRLKSYDCDFGTYLRRSEEDLEAEERLFAERGRKLKQEEAWALQGVKARRTRSQGRVRALERLRTERREQQVRAGNIKVRAQQAERSGQLVIEALGVSHRFGESEVIRGFSSLVMRGDKIGLMGKNGSGKTTLLRILLGELKPTQGTVRHGTRLQVAYFDQLHHQLDESLSVREAVADGSDMIQIGQGQRHVVGYLRDFLFEPDRLDTPVRRLSGGERNRLLLARLFTRPSNLLVMDEPTNDLDVETLELLEGLLVEYQGTVLLVSHDREFLNNVVTSSFVLEGDGVVGEYVGGYDDWLLQRTPPEEAPDRKARSKARTRAPKAESGPRKRTYAEKLEFAKLPERIEVLERELDELHACLLREGFYTGDPEEIGRVTRRLPLLEQELETAYERWTELDELADR